MIIGDLQGHVGMLLIDYGFRVPFGGGPYKMNYSILVSVCGNLLFA